MTILLGYESALSYWRTCANERDARNHRALLGDSSARNRATNEAVYRLSQPQGRRASIEYLAHDPKASLLVVGGQAASRTSNLPHTISRLPARSCIHAERLGVPSDVIVSTPEFCFLQMANVLPFEQLILLGFELCGTYSCSQQETLYNTLPLTTPEKLSRFMRRAEGIRGIKKSRRATRYIIENSASPMESILTILLCLPYSLGGYGLKRPQMNYRIDLPPEAHKKTGSHYFKCDLYWKEEKIAIEYDSDFAHSGINKTIRDALRQTALTSLGISVLSVTRPQVMNTGALNKFAHLVAYKMKKRLRYKDPEFTRKHLSLHQALLFSGSSD